jgi:hypothetical protein
MRDSVRILGVCIAVTAFAAVKPANAQTAPKSTASGQHEPATLEAAATFLWDSVLARCGADYYYHDPKGGFIQFRGVTFHTNLGTVSPADRLNGVEWRGWAIMVPSPYRIHDSDDASSKWSKWQDGEAWHKYEADTLNGGDEGLHLYERHFGWFSVYIRKSHGVLKVGYPFDSDGDLNLPKNVSCAEIPKVAE